MWVREYGVTTGSWAFSTSSALMDDRPPLAGRKSRRGMADPPPSGATEPPHDHEPHAAAELSAKLRKIGFGLAAGGAAAALLLGLALIMTTIAIPNPMVHRKEDRAPVIRVFGDEIPLRAHVEVLAGYSAHGDRTELQHWLDRVRDGGTERRIPQVYLVHGEIVAQDMFADQLRRAGYATVHAPERHESITL